MLGLSFQPFMERGMAVGKGEISTTPMAAGTPISPLDFWLRPPRKFMLIKEAVIKTAINRGGITGFINKEKRVGWSGTTDGGKFLVFSVFWMKSATCASAGTIISHHAGERIASDSWPHTCARNVDRHHFPRTTVNSHGLVIGIHYCRPNVIQVGNAVYARIAAHISRHPTGRRSWNIGNNSIAEVTGVNHGSQGQLFKVADTIDALRSLLGLG